MSELAPPPSSDVQLLFLGGFGYGEYRNRLITDQLAQAGYSVIAPPADAAEQSRKGFVVTFPDGHEQPMTRREMIKAQLGKTPLRSSIAECQRDQAATLQTHIEKAVPDGSKLSIIAQSADAQNSLLYAARYPETVENLIFVNPAGIIAQPRLSKAAANVLKSVFKSRRRKVKVAPEDLFEQPIKRTQRKLGSFASAASVALSDQRDILHQMRQSEAAPGVAVVLGIHDLIVQPEEIIKGLVSANDVDRIVIADMTHGINGRKDILDEVAGLVPQLTKDKEAYRRGEAPPPLAEKISFYGDIPASVQKQLLALACQRAA